MKIKNLLILTSVILILSMSYIGCGSSTNLSSLTSQELYTLGKEKYDDNKFMKAVTYFQTIVYNYPGESIVDTAQFYLASSYFGADEHELAQVEFNRLVVNYPSSVYFQEGLFMKAVSYYEGTPGRSDLDQSDIYTAIKHFEDFIIDYPESELIPQAKDYRLKAITRLAKKDFNTAIVYQRIGGFRAAEIYYQKVVDEFTESEYGHQASFGVAKMLFRQKLYEEASTKFGDFLIVFPKSDLVEKARKIKIESDFKSGQLSFESGELESARTKFEAFIKDYPEHDKAAEANKYLSRIQPKGGTENAGS